ncbi:PLP-dependent aminotransferase family protein [Aestuariivirga sp.]|uniref:MocR-like ectoine utilization transcription factor EhuR n=1 Tax=Aestuariivirga sp. TaxID=2650926 RepID=UPI003BAC38E7
MWSPQIDCSAGRLYVALAEALADDIAAGRLVPGERLPTHRELAWHLKLSVSTVSKAYALAERRRLIQGEVGRGTFVTPRSSDLSRAEPNRAQPDLIDLSFNCPVLFPETDAAVAKAMQEAAIGGMDKLLPYHRQWLGLPHHRAAAAQWLSTVMPEMAPEDIVVVNGAQHGTAAILAALTAPGDVVAIEELADPGIRFLTSNRQLTTRSVAMDAGGIIPDSLEAICRTERIAALICMPTHQSPTLAVMPAERRLEIAEIARRHKLTIIENDVYGHLSDQPLPTLASMLPESCFYINSLSKTVAPGLRVGFIVAPSDRGSDLIPGLAATTWMTSPLSAEIASRLIGSGAAADIARRQREEMRKRQELAQRILSGHRFSTLPAAMHLWLQLPETWRAESFVASLKRRGVAVTPAEAFATGHGTSPHSVRLSLGGATADRSELQQGLQIVAEMLANRPPSSFLLL